MHSGTLIEDLLATVERAQQDIRQIPSTIGGLESPKAESVASLENHDLPIEAVRRRCRNGAAHTP